MWNKSLITNYLRMKKYEYAQGYGVEYRVDNTFCSDLVDCVEVVLDCLQKDMGVNVYMGIYQVKARYIFTNIKVYLEPNEETEVRNTLKRHEERCSIFPKQKRDFQRSKVYKWERYALKKAGTSLYDNKLTEDQVNDLVADISKEYGIKTPKVIISNAKKSNSTYYPGRHEIRLVKSWGTAKGVVLHETAHALTRYNIAHGKEFCGAVVELYSRYLSVDKQHLINTMLDFGIKYDSTWKSEVKT